MEKTYKGTLLEYFVQVAPYINDLVIRDVAVAVTDREKFLCYYPGEHIDHGIKPGDPVKEGSVTYNAMKNKKLTVLRVEDRKLYGFPYIGVAMPIFDKQTGEMIGSVFFGENTDQQDTLWNMAEELSAATRQVNESAQKISAEAQELASLGQELNRFANDSYEQIKNIDGIMAFIKNIASQTNLLGLNAAIEAARVGDAGRGFGVVADEIRKLSSQSSESVDKIQPVLEKIKHYSEEIKRAVEAMSSIANSQAASIQAIAGSVEEISSMVEELSSLAEKMSKKDEQ